MPDAVDIALAIRRGTLTFSDVPPEQRPTVARELRNERNLVKRAIEQRDARPREPFRTHAGRERVR